MVKEFAFGTYAPVICNYGPPTPIKTGDNRVGVGKGVWGWGGGGGGKERAVFFFISIVLAVINSENAGKIAVV